MVGSDITGGAATELDRVEVLGAIIAVDGGGSD